MSKKIDIEPLEKVIKMVDKGAWKFNPPSGDEFVTALGDVLYVLKREINRDKELWSYVITVYKEDECSEYSTGIVRAYTRSEAINLVKEHFKDELGAMKEYRYTILAHEIDLIHSVYPVPLK